MAAIYETAYPRIKPHLSNRELKEIFTPTKNELLLLKDSTKKTNDVSRVAFMILLKGYQYLGRPINVNKIGEPIKKHIAKKLDVLPEIDLGKYPKSSRKRHIKIIRIHLEINWLHSSSERNIIYEAIA